MVLVCISMMTSDAEHLFKCLFAVLNIFLGELPVQIICPFKKLGGLFY